MEGNRKMVIGRELAGRALLLGCGLFLLGGAGIAQDGGSDPRVEYDIEVRYEPERHTVEGKATIVWRSPADEPVTDLWFHLYLNAFKNERTSLMRETSASRREGFRKGEWGTIDLVSVKQVLVEGGEAGQERRIDLLASLEFMQPDDGNPWDQTVAMVVLAEPVLPGGRVQVEVGFISRFPHAYSRTGYHGEYLMAAQWFPKLGVYRTKSQAKGVAPPWNQAGWYCPQYHAHCEFFSDFGAYRVSITAPSGTVIGATGKIEAEIARNSDGTSTWRFAQERVHDFAWVADPHFVVFEKTFDPTDAESLQDLFTGAEQEAFVAERSWVKAALGLSEAELSLSEVKVRLLLQPDHVSQSARFLKAAFVGLRYYGLWFGAYPYDTLTIVDPAFGAGATGGMEYPTLITTGTRFLAHPSGTRPEGVTLHEFAHQFWYGLVANDEFEEAWLDEGLTVYTTAKAMSIAYPDRIETKAVGGFDIGAVPLIPLAPDVWSAEPFKSLNVALPMLRLDRAWLPDNDLLQYFRDLPFLNFLSNVPKDPWSRRYERLTAVPPGMPIRTRSYEFFDRGDYARAVYDKASLTMATLEGIVGRELFLKTMREFQSRYRFGSPVGDDFLRVLNEISGRDFTAMFETMMETAATVDFEVVSVESEVIGGSDGIYDEGGERIVIGPKSFAEAKEEERKGRSWLGVSIDEEEEIDPSGARYLNTWVVWRHGGLSLPVEIEYKIEGKEHSERLEWNGREVAIRHSFEDSGRLEWVRVDPDREILLDRNWGNNFRAAEAGFLANRSRRFTLDLFRWMMSMLHYYGNLAVAERHFR